MLKSSIKLMLKLRNSNNKVKTDRANIERNYLINIQIL